jgi:hypothetical protein
MPGCKPILIVEFVSVIRIVAIAQDVTETEYSPQVLNTSKCGESSHHLELCFINDIYFSHHKKPTVLKVTISITYHEIMKWIKLKLTIHPYVYTCIISTSITNQSKHFIIWFCRIKPELSSVLLLLTAVCS